MSLISSTFTQCPELMYPTLEALLRGPEEQSLLQQVHDQLDKISIRVGEEAFPALWCWGEKEIVLHPDLLEEDSRTQLISYLIFELCNAKRTQEFKALEEKDVDAFVEAFERIEHASFLETNRLFSNPRFRSFEDFDSHYKLQQLAGHSEWIARKYFPNQTYRGTWPISLSEMSSIDRRILLNFMQCQLNVERGFEVEKSKQVLAYIRRMADSDHSSALRTSIKAD